MTEPLPLEQLPQAAQDELTELGDELRRKARPGERLVETHRRLTEESQERRWRGHLLEKIVETLPVNIFAKDSEHRYVIVNEYVINVLDRDRSDVVGKTDFDLFAESTARQLRASDEQVRKGGRLQLEEREVERKDGEKRHLYVGKTLVHIEEPEEQMLVGFSIDITETKRVEQDLRDKIALIERQQTKIQALSAPIIEVWDQVLTMPILDVLDSERAGAVSEKLLAEVSRKGARFTILDLTGIETMDAATATHLLRVVQAIRLLGVEGILTGIQPSVARTMATLGLGLESVTTLRDLRDGLRHCMKQMRDHTHMTPAVDTPSRRPGWSG